MIICARFAGQTPKRVLFTGGWKTPPIVLHERRVATGCVRVTIERDSDCRKFPPPERGGSRRAVVTSPPRPAATDHRTDRGCQETQRAPGRAPCRQDRAG